MAFSMSRFGTLAMKLAGVAGVTRGVVTRPVTLPLWRACTSSGTRCCPVGVTLTLPLLTWTPHPQAHPPAAESVTHESAEYVEAIARRTPGRLHSDTQLLAFPLRWRHIRSA